MFAYGQTASGKTHTLFGPPKFFDMDPVLHWGACPRALMQMVNSTDRLTCDLRVSAVEIYFDDVFDLLNKRAAIPITGFGKNVKSASVGRDFMQVQRDADGKWIPPYLNGKKNSAVVITGSFETQGAFEWKIEGVEDVLRIMQIVESTRSAKSHAMNERSSRSHCILTVILSNNHSAAGACGGGGGNCSASAGASKRQLTQSKFLFVDLAGSERITKTEVVNVAAAEAKNINTSLSALGRTIQMLRKRKGDKDAYVPWRDSALTMLMKQSLSGNCRTALVVTVNENNDHAAESQSTLRFGVSCGSLRNEVARDVRETDGELDMLRGLLLEVNLSLAHMQAKGMHGELMLEQFPRPTCQGFVDNFRKLRGAEADVAAALARGGSKTSEHVKELQFVADNLKGILLRQITTGIWREPKPGYMAKCGEKADLESSIARLVPGKEPSAAPPDLMAEMSARLTIRSLVAG
eukprot:CAMPEP_0183459592 /NCGR_PEP_ID=MMETSP0370-20130417/135906_1 /TAXON_ID=268820 /ORGANISM="Peridinium aciculiferum, Strain PAER-2" /LENGTH=464 /DNA_ID=CAMNT_0025651435 /DNA_START=14 /DNA_END=1408 /DNA_ORIENTATION=+